MSDLHGCAILAQDGKVGTVADFLFDDLSWRVRWLVIDTGDWLSDRKVLLPPSVLGHLDPIGRAFSVQLTRQQVKDSPDIATDLPVSRQMESNVFDYYGWSPYWFSGFYVGDYGYRNNLMATVPEIGARIETSDLEQHSNPGDPHLRSAETVAGYHLHARDGEVGHVENFLLQEADWSIHYLVVDTRNWWPGKKVLISPRSVRDIDWTDEVVNLSVDRQSVKNSPAYDPSENIDRVFEAHFHQYYTDIR